jgi:hypothetical protein
MTTAPVEDRAGPCYRLILFKVVDNSDYFVTHG